jgi:hypothetical protein
MSIVGFFLTIVLLSQMALALTILGTTAAWPRHKLDHRNLFFLVGVWLALNGLVILLLGLRGYSLTIPPILGGLYGLLLAALMAIATSSRSRPLTVWLASGLFCLFFTGGLAMLLSGLIFK